MYRQTYKQPRTSMVAVGNTTEGEYIEEKMRRIMQNKEPIKDGAKLLYADRAEGVKPESDIRTDIWEIATEKMDATHRRDITKRKGGKPDKKAEIGEEAKAGMAAEAKTEGKGGEPTS